MWETMWAAAQAPALQWLVVAIAVAAFAWKIAMSDDGALWGDLLVDDVEDGV